MSVSVTITFLIHAKEVDYEIDRDFDTLPRIGETVVFSDVMKPAVGGAYCRVEDVVHAWGSIGKHPVHAYIVVQPKTLKDANALVQLFPDMEQAGDDGGGDE